MAALLLSTAGAAAGKSLFGSTGAIIGRALYEGTLDFAAAQKIAQ